MTQENARKGRWGRRMLLSTAASLLLGAGLTTSQAVGTARAQNTPTVELSQAVQAAPVSFADLVERVKPAVVNISTTQRARPAAAPQERELPFPIPPGYEEFFKRFFGEEFGRQAPPRPPGETSSLGSGFVIDPAGWVVTNNHVIGEAEQIKVVLQDGTSLDAQVRGRDEKTDIALLKVEPRNPLPFVAFGDSSRARVGDWVVAVGNPFGLGGTVTAGIISAHGRNINAGPYDDFMQIDAAINRGNSGGPTFNLAGEVIGVNTAIFSPSGGSIGIGFAIPADMAKMVVGELRAKGRVDRGWLGVQIQDMTPEIAQGLGLASEKGALVAEVLPGPARDAGFRQGDVVVSFGGAEVAGARDLPRLVAATAAGKKVPVTVIRDGQTTTIDVTIGKMPADDQVAAAPAQVLPTDRLGLVLGELTPQARQELDVPENVAGVVVQDVHPDSPAAKNGIRKGDVIVSVNQKPVAAPREVSDAIEQARKDKKNSVVVLVNRDGNQRFVALQLPA